MTGEPLCVTGITGITGFWANLPIVEKKEDYAHCTSSLYICYFYKPVILVIPVTDGDLCVINLLEPVIT